jgi:hypothetical protein
VIEGEVRVVGANEASWDDLQAVFGRGAASGQSSASPSALAIAGRVSPRPLTETAVAYARVHGAKAVEGYPMVPKPGQDVSWGEMNVGSQNTFMAAGSREVSRPTTRRVAMRLDLD